MTIIKCSFPHRPSASLGFSSLTYFSGTKNELNFSSFPTFYWLISQPIYHFHWLLTEFLGLWTYFRSQSMWVSPASKKTLLSEPRAFNTRILVWKDPWLCGCLGTSHLLSGHHLSHIWVDHWFGHLSCGVRNGTICFHGTIFILYTSIK